MPKRHVNKYKQSQLPFIAEATLDYHDRGVLLPYDIEKLLTEFIEDHYNLHHRSLLVVTGKGEIVRPLVEKLLARNKLVHDFHYAGYFNGQNGAFEVELVM